MILNDVRRKMMEEFVKDYGAQLTGSSIAKKKKLNQKTAANILNESEREGFLKSRTQGRNKLYYINLENKERVIHFISIIEHARAITFYKKHIVIKEISERLIGVCNGVVAIFGSYAKGTEKKGSDLDVFVAGKCEKKAIDKISELFNIEINVKVYPANIFKKALVKRDHLIEEIIKDHIIINGTDLFVRDVAELRYGKN